MVSSTDGKRDIAGWTVPRNHPGWILWQEQEGAYVFEGTINSTSFQVRIDPTGGNSYAFQAEGAGAALNGIGNPVTVATEDRRQHGHHKRKGVGFGNCSDAVTDC